MRRRSEIVPRPWATGAPAIRPVSGQRINCLGDLDWPRWEGPEQGSRNCVGGAAERPLRRPQGRQRARQSPPASLPFEKEGKIPGVPEEPEPGANDACLKSPRSLMSLTTFGWALAPMSIFQYQKARSRMPK